MENKELLKLARMAIESHLHDKEIKIDNEIKKKFSKKQASFVTLTINNELRGCIGSLEARQELWKDVVENAVHAGFHDFRFTPLSENELGKIKIEVSILTTPIKLDYKNEKNLLDKIDRKMGLILRKQGYSSTFLPQVWEQINGKIEFLEQLSLKAGLRRDNWKNAEFWSYRVEKVKED